MRTTQELLQALNSEQQEAVTAVDGPVLVVAGPGSGKTRVLTHRIAYLIAEGYARPHQILAVTFTNKAAREMRERLAQLLDPWVAERVMAGTFHGICTRLLRVEYAALGYPSFVIYDDEDQLALVRHILEELNLDPKRFSPRAILARISAAKNQQIAPASYPIESYFDEVVARVYSQYQQRLERVNALDFDDLLTKTLALFDEFPDVLQRYQDRWRYIHVDEYQDTNHLQYLLVRALARGHQNLFVVGDPDQSIYGWRHADIRNILTFKQDYPDAREIHLSLNYRSTATIVRAADHVIRANRLRIQRTLRTLNDTGLPITLWACADDLEEAMRVVEEIRILVARGIRQYRDFAILYRTNAQSQPLEQALVQAGIPYQLIGGLRFYERREIKDALALLRILINPADDVSLRRVIENTPLGNGIGKQTWRSLERLATQHAMPIGLLLRDHHLACCELTGRVRQRLAILAEHLQRWQTLSCELSASALFARMLDEAGLSALYREARDPEDIDRWENLTQFASLLQQYDQLPADQGIPLFLDEAALVTDADLLNDERNHVTLITFHAAKGLEFPVVFLVGIEEGLVPHSRSIENEAELEEERRLFYVGLTRAKEQVYISFASRRLRWGTSSWSVRSRFLDDIPRELLEYGGKPERRSFHERSSEQRTLTQHATAPTVRLTKGMRVFHKTFGDGIVVDVQDLPRDQEIAVAFKRHGTKRFLASLANLTVE
jgi:DNA helicase-2/ATP-dependent DNA helicase PcrA